MHAIGFQFAETNKSVNLFLFIVQMQECECVGETTNSINEIHSDDKLQYNLCVSDLGSN